MMRFKDLSVGTIFEFNREGVQFSGMVTGPWVKLSARQYAASDKENSLYGHRLTVGSINVKVIEP